MAIDSAASAAAQASYLVERRTPRSVVWRFAVLTLLYEYESRRQRHGGDIAARMFEVPPPHTGDRLIDDALAAFAEYFARRDDFSVPAWAEDSFDLTHRRPGKYARRSRQRRQPDAGDESDPLLPFASDL